MATMILIAISKKKKKIFSTFFYLIVKKIPFSFSINNAVQLSCVVQKMWINISTICHGLLGGLGMYIYTVL